MSFIKNITHEEVLNIASQVSIQEEPHIAVLS